MLRKVSKKMNEAKFFGMLRIVMAWIFLWSFFDKTFGLGFSTSSENAWINGGSPTQGYLMNSTSGPLEPLYHGIAGMAWVDWTFMLGTLLIGLALLLGIGMKVASYSGILLMILMWSTTLPPSKNPIFTYHILYALVLYGFTRFDSSWMSLSMYWKELDTVKNNPWLE